MDACNHIFAYASSPSSQSNSIPSDYPLQAQADQHQAPAVPYQIFYQEHSTAQHEPILHESQPSVASDFAEIYRASSHRQLDHKFHAQAIYHRVHPTMPHPSSTLAPPYFNAHISSHPSLFAPALPRQITSTSSSSSIHSVNTFGQSQGSATSNLTHYQAVQDLFGYAHPRYITACGNSSALSLLQEAISIERLMVSPDPQACHDAFTSSLRPLQRKGIIADPETPDTGEGRFALDEMSWHERAAFDIKPSDFVVSPVASVQHLGLPAFLGNIDFILAFLRIMSKYHSSSQSRFQLGIVTKSGSQEYEVQIFESQLGHGPAHTVWMYRDCVGNVSVDGSWVELWYPFVVSRTTVSPSDGGVEYDMQRVSGLLEPRFTRDPSPGNVRPDWYTSSRTRKRRKTVTTRSSSRRVIPHHSGSQAAAQLFVSNNIAGRMRWKGAQHKQDVAHLFTHLTDEEILSGYVHPDNIVGTLMLRLVPRYSNSTLWERINNLYKRLDPDNSKEVSRCAIAKRWTLALKHICKTSNIDYTTEMNRYLEMRRRNGILTKSAGSKIQAGHGVDDGDSGSSDEDDAVVSAMSATRTRSKRKCSVVRYASPKGSLELARYDGAVENQVEANGRRSKRQRVAATIDEDRFRCEEEDNDGPRVVSSLHGCVHDSVRE